MHYCERCGSHLGGAYACPACGTPYSAPPTWQAPPTAAPPAGPHPLYQSLIPPMPEPAPYEAPESPREEPAEPAEESPAPPAPARRRGAARSRRAARRRGGKTKLALGVTGGLVLVGLAATVLPGELLPTGSSQADNAGTSSSAMQTPTATASAPAVPQTATPVRKPVAHRPAHSAQPSLSAAPSGTTAHTALPVSAPVAPAHTQPGTPPPPTPTQPTPSPRPRPTQPPTCFLLWCD